MEMVSDENDDFTTQFELKTHEEYEKYLGDERKKVLKKDYFCPEFFKIHEVKQSDKDRLNCFQEAYNSVYQTLDKIFTSKAGLTRFNTSGSGAYCFFNAIFKIQLPFHLTEVIPLKLLDFYQKNSSRIYRRKT